MAHFNSDLNPNDEVIGAIQVILNAFSRTRNDLKTVQTERDLLLAQIKTFENKSSMGDRINTQLNENQRKRIKSESLNFDDSILQSSMHNESTDALNAAFHLNVCEDDIIYPSQAVPIQHKSTKISPGYKDKTYKRQNKENKENSVTAQNSKEKSPTILSKRFDKIELKPDLGGNVSNDKLITDVKCATVLKNTSQFHLKPPTKKPIPFTNETSTTTTQRPNTNPRKKLSLAMYSPRLKQTLSNFNKCNEETYYEEAPIDANESKMTEYGDDYTKSGKRRVDSCSVIALSNVANEIIEVDDANSTEDLYQHVFDIIKELEARNSRDEIPYLPKTKSPPKNEDIDDCELCAQYHRMLGRGEMSRSKKYGVCWKHHRNVQVLQTPPGFWNPKIPDSDSDHESTHFDYAVQK